MTTVVPKAPVVRLPVQGRSRLVWQRILDAGVEVLCDIGVARFNISAVCDRAGVAMTAVYSRVDSRDDLLHATYDHGVATLQSTELRLADAVATPSPRAAIDVVAAVFVEHARFLRPTILAGGDDAYLFARGAENLANARQVFVRTAVGDAPSPELRNRAETLFTATFSTLAFELAFGSELVHGRSGLTSVSELHTISDALLPDAGGSPGRHQEPAG